MFYKSSVKFWDIFNFLTFLTFFMFWLVGEVYLILNVLFSLCCYFVKLCFWSKNIFFCLHCKYAPRRPIRCCHSILSGLARNKFFVKKYFSAAKSFGIFFRCYVEFQGMEHLVHIDFVMFNLYRGVVSGAEAEIGRFWRVFSKSRKTTVFSHSSMFIWVWSVCAAEKFIIEAESLVRCFVFHVCVPVVVFHSFSSRVEESLIFIVRGTKWRHNASKRRVFTFAMAEN